MPKPDNGPSPADASATHSAAPRKGTEGYGHVLKYTGIFGSVQGLYILMAVVRAKLTAVLIGTTGAGMVDLYNRTADFLTNATNLGISFSAVRQLSALHADGRQREAARYVCLVRTWTLLTAAAGTLLCAVLAPQLSRMTTGTEAYTADFRLLALMVGMGIVLGGEQAVMKGMRALTPLAALSALGAATTLVLTVPLYALLGLTGIAPALVASMAALLALHLWRSTRLCPWRIDLRMRFVRQGGPLVRLGVAFVTAGMLGTGAELLVRAFIVHRAGLAEAGLFSTGVTLTVSYARMILSAMDADYFPRLSVARDGADANAAINRQIDVLALLMAPFLIAFALALPLAVRLLYTRDFLGVVPMVLAAEACMFFKAIYSPIAYLPLARGHSRVYLAMELTYDAVFAAGVVAGYLYGGLAGAGAAIAAAHLFDLALVGTVYRRRYGFRFLPATLRRCALQALLLAAGLAAAWMAEPAWRYGAGGAALLLSCGCSWRWLAKATGLDLRGRLRRKQA